MSEHTEKDTKAKARRERSRRAQIRQLQKALDYYKILYEHSVSKNSTMHQELARLRRELIETQTKK